MKLMEIVKVYDLKPLISELIMPARTAYKFSKLFKKAAEEKDFYTEELQKLIDEYAEHDENGKAIEAQDGIQLKKESLNEFQLKLNDLWNLEIDYDGILFSLDELDNVKLTVEQFDFLLPFIKEKTEI